jgi:hypothetical protein
MKTLEYDIFISYAPSDNNQVTKDEKGWVDNLKYFLNKVFSQVISETPRFLEYANREKPTAEQLSKVGVMICVVSPDYVKKASCIDDILLFCEQLKNSGVSEEEINQRIFKVVKYPVPLEDLPSKIRNLIGYDLFSVDINTGRLDEYKDFFSSEAETNYWLKLVDLAYDVQDILHIIKDSSERKDKLEVGKGDAIYLAETSPDLLLQRNIIKRELQKYGYKVLPDRTLPGNMREMEATIKKDLENCRMSIHLIGGLYGEIPKGSDASIVEIQNKFAAERSHFAAITQKTQDDPAFSRLIWLSPEMKLLNDKQLAFIENLKKEVEAEETTEMVQTPLEDFKNIIRRELHVDERIKSENNAVFHPDQSRRSAAAKIYVIYDKIDQQAVKPILEYVENRDFEVITLSKEGSLIDIQKNHVENLKNFDAAIIYQGLVSEQWVRMKILDLLKAPGYGRKKPIVAKILIAGKGAKNFEYAESFDVEIIDSTQSFSLDELEVILNQVS